MTTKVRVNDPVKRRAYREANKEAIRTYQIENRKRINETSRQRYAIRKAAGELESDNSSDVTKE